MVQFSPVSESVFRGKGTYQDRNTFLDVVNKSAQRSPRVQALQEPCRGFHDYGANYYNAKGNDSYVVLRIAWLSGLIMGFKTS